MTAPYGDPMVGRTVAQYDIIARVGGGGMGVVYRARDIKLGRSVALKFLPEQWSHDETARLRFLREAQAASATNHPNICTIHDIETADDGQLFIVMAYYEGRTLKQRLESGPLAVDEALDVATQIADGLAKAHAQGVVHRDVKPGNVMLTEDGARILDFGLATFADALKLTTDNAMLGTAAYMSPEQVRGQSADARSDVWAVGAVLYEMLTGQVPFQGSHAEAIGHAIRNESPTPIRAERPEVGEEVEQLVFRALHKDPTVRFQSGRELARALRQVRGQTIPLDLRTEPVPLPARAIPPRPTRSWKGWVTAAGALLLAGVGMAYLSTPVERPRVVIVPVVNQTGYSELDAYRLALTHELVRQLSDSSLVRVVPYERLLPVIRRFRRDGADVSSLASIRAITEHSGVPTVIVATLMYEDRQWKARVEMRNANTAISEATYDTEPVVSSLMTETAHALMVSLADRVEAHFIDASSHRIRVTRALRRLLAPDRATRARPMATLDAAASFEEGLSAYSELEYATAARFFGDASSRDSGNALLHAWRSRALRMMRRDEEATQTAGEALRTLGQDTADRLLVEAIAAESRRDLATAEARYRRLADREPDEANWAMELAGFFDREGRSTEAVDAYVRALAADPRLLVADVELCRMYNRLGQSLKAREHAERARTNLRAAAATAEEAQALLCLADALRFGSAQDQRAAKVAAGDALARFEQLGASYNIARAYNYLAMIAGRQGNRTEALAFGEKALASAKSAGNEVIQALVLMNLGVTSAGLGDRSRAGQYYQQSYQRYRALGDQARAAEIQANRGALLIDFGPSPDDGLREVLNALEVVRRQENTDFEAFCLHVIAGYYRYAGLRTEAESYLNQALSIARQFQYGDKVAAANLDAARLAFDAADYQTARDSLVEAIGASTDEEARTAALIHLSRVHARMGNFESARTELAKVSSTSSVQNTGLRPLWHLAHGELAYAENRLETARASFRDAAASWTDDLPDTASVEGRAYVGLFDALAGRRASGRRAIESCRDYARGMGRRLLEARCRMFLARMDVEAGKFDDALTTLRGIPDDDSRFGIGRELRAQVHYWRKRALLGLGDVEAAQAQDRAARLQIQVVRDLLPIKLRASFDARPDIRLILG